MFSASVIKAIEKIADRLQVPLSSLLAVAETESGGRATWPVHGQPMPAIRFEGHYFHRRLKGKQLEEAVAAGLAHPRAGRVKNPRSFEARYDMLQRAMKINAQAALESISMGLGQVMGAHWKSLGFKSVEEMWQFAKSGIPGQVEIMARFIEKNNLARHLRSKNWAAFAKAYNGPAYKKNAYDTKMATADTRWAERLRTGDVPASGKVEGTLFMEQQRKLKELGFYKGKVDGLDGPKSREAVREFQRAHGLKVDGRLGPITDREIDRAYARRQGKIADKVTGTGVGTTTCGGAGEAVKEAIDNLQPAAYDLTWLNYVILFLIIVGLGLTAYGLYRKFTSNRVITDEFDEPDPVDPYVNDSTEEDE